MYQVPIRNKVTGEERNFFGGQEIADFLAEREDAGDWTGFEFMGGLPAPTVQTAPAAPEEPAA